MSRHLEMTDALDLKILTFLRANPGARVGDFTAAIGVSDSTARYRLLILQIFGHVVAKRSRNSVEYYLTPVGEAITEHDATSPELS